MAGGLYTGFAESFETVTVSSSAIGLSGDTRGITGAHIDVEGGAIRFRIDGSNPTSLVGHPVENGGRITIIGSHNIDRLRMIASDGEPSSVASVTLFKGA